MAASTSVTSPSDPLLSWTMHGDQLSAVASGVWTCANADRLERLTDSLDRQPASAVTLDISGVGELDTVGGWLIERAVRQANSRKQIAAARSRSRSLSRPACGLGPHQSPGRGGVGRRRPPRGGAGGARRESLGGWR